MENTKTGRGDIGRADSRRPWWVAAEAYGMGVKAFDEQIDGGYNSAPFTMELAQEAPDTWALWPPSSSPPSASD